MDRLTIPEAAVRLGLSENALRKRVHRDTIEHEKDEEGRVFVYLSPGVPPTTSDQADGQASDQVDGLHRLIARLEGEVEYLRRETEDWKEEARRKDTIIMTMAQRIPELEAVPDASQRPVTDSGEGSGVEEEYPEGQRASWWQRWFG